jgi:integrase
VQDIDLDLVMKVIEPIWNTKTETARRIRGRIEVILDWAKVRGYRSGENPARWRGQMDQLLPARAKLNSVKHHAALPYSELPDFMKAVRAIPGNSAAALEFLILTAARTSEVIDAKWAEIDFKKKTWTVPAARMKSRREHRVPLSSAAIAVLKRMEEGKGEYVFPGPATIRLAAERKTDCGDGSSEREAWLCSARRHAVRRHAGDDCNSIATVRHSISELSSNGLLR